MCELLAMNCNVPTDICFSLAGFQARGGKTGVHKDGWGIAFFEGKGVRQFLDPEPSADSRMAEFIRSYPIKSKNVVAHIRKATHGDVNLENTHPFSRELWGRNWIFAHNGDVPAFSPELTGRFQPIGSTDSERAFCFIMQELEKAFPQMPESGEELFEVLAKLVEPIKKFGSFNFVLSNGNFLAAHCSTNLSYIVRKAPFSLARLKDQDVTVDFSSLTSPTDRVAVIATYPLTENETWTVIPAGTLFIFREGEVHSQFVNGARA